MLRIRIKELTYYNPQKWSKLLEILFGLVIPDPDDSDPNFLPIPDQSDKKAPDPGSRSATLVFYSHHSHKGGRYTGTGRYLFC